MRDAISKDLAHAISIRSGDQDFHHGVLSGVRFVAALDGIVVLVTVIDCR